jgi:hypothetical protein
MTPSCQGTIALTSYVTGDDILILAANLSTKTARLLLTAEEED